MGSQGPTSKVGNLTNGGIPNGFIRPESSKITVVLGSQWGDEGKGKLVDLLAAETDIVCRCQVS